MVPTTAQVAILFLHLLITQAFGPAVSAVLAHYGLHGAPEPGTIGMTQSHGCVRLTNWDAARVAALVKPGTRVLFR
jgi:lipoprotein-anchoring transpeptidase ErfK/SrfK